jgi:surface antigen
MVVGVWVQSSGGGSKWASFSRVAGAPHKANYSATLSTAVPTNVQLHVGCGYKSGSTVDWWSNNRTNNTRIGGSVTRNAVCAEAAGTGTRCDWIPAGTNPYPSGQCTWGMADKWGKQTGAYPNWALADAKYWGGNAKVKGWTVSSVPRVRSIVVIQPGAWPLSSASEGHVAWVTGLNKNTAGQVVSLNIVDMNGKVSGAWGPTYVRPYKPSGMAFIYAP